MAILGLLVIGFFLYFIFNKKNVDNSKNIETPLELLQKRFVNGEINEEEYLEKKKVLS